MFLLKRFKQSLIVAVTTLVGAISGALVGSLGTYILQGRRRKKQHQKEIEELRDSLLAELSTMDDLRRTDQESRDDILSVGMYIPSNVYGSNTQKLSILTRAETDAIIRFYSGALKYQKSVEETANVVLNGDISIDEIIKEHDEKDKFRQEWVRCVMVLLENSDTYPDVIQFEGEKIEPNSSDNISFEKLWVFLNHEGISDKGMEVKQIVNDK